MNALTRVLIGLALLHICAAQSYAHQIPNSVVNFDFGAQTVRAELWMPLSELRYAFPALRDVDKANSAAEYGIALRAYVLNHVSAETALGEPWSVKVATIDATRFDSHEYLTVTLVLKPPEQGSVRQFVWHDDAITHEVRNHFIMLVARSDYATGLVGADAQLIAFLQHPITRFSIDRGAPQAGAGFRAAYRLGVAHIAEGTDHLLFLLTLLLPASLLAIDKQWQRRRTLPSSLRQLLAVATAFTVGHSLTLAGSVAFGWHTLAQPVEVLIAVSIFMSAIHAWRPLFPGWEPLVAGVFGLIHGLAFATALDNHVIDLSSKAFAILGFNLGIESVQVLVICLAMPILYVVQPLRFAAPLRRLVAVLVGAVAFLWIISRLELFDLRARYFEAAPFWTKCVGLALGIAATWILACRLYGRYQPRPAQIGNVPDEHVERPYSAVLAMHDTHPQSKCQLEGINPRATKPGSSANFLAAPLL